MSEKIITEVQFVKTVRLGKSSIPFDYVRTDKSSVGSNRTIDDSEVIMTLTANEDFVKVHLVKHKFTQLVPMSNVAGITLESVK